WVDQVGVDTVVEQLRDLTGTHGDRFSPSQMLVEMAEKGDSFFGQ
ncbi:MAG: hypothetical protein HKO82_10240, partial [Acidimicrobiia bacterium]|nr:hypothetical protein [Acidimicrobiia bacterium]